MSSGNLEVSLQAVHCPFKVLFAVMSQSFCMTSSHSAESLIFNIKIDNCLTNTQQIHFRGTYIHVQCNSSVFLIINNVPAVSDTVGMPILVITTFQLKTVPEITDKQ